MKLSPQLQERILTAIEGLEADPRPSGVKKLKGKSDAYPVRVGDYRVLYTVQDGLLLVLVVKIAKRSDAYR